MPQLGETITLNVLRYSDCFRQIDHVLGGSVAPELNPREIVDEAGEYLASMAPWNWLGTRSEHLPLRTTISIATATWTELTKTLTKVGAFASYTYVAGDTIDILGGTGASQRRFTLDQDTAPTDDAIVLTESIGAGADGLSDISGKLHNDTVALPDSMRDLRGITATDAVVNGINLTTIEDILARRSSQVDVTSSWNYYGAFNYAGDPPVPIIEIWPTTSTDTANAFTIFYRSGWLPGTAGLDTDVLSIPAFMHSCMKQLVRIFALGYEEGFERGRPSLQTLLAEFETGPMLARARQRDGEIQSTMGAMRGGGVQSMATGGYVSLSSQVDAPT